MTTETERLARVEALLEEMRDNLRRLEARQEANFRWLMGAILGMWVTVISVVLGALLTR